MGIGYMGLTIAEKILARASDNTEVFPDEIVEAKVDLAMSHDNTVLVSEYFNELPGSNVWDPQKIVVVLDHRSPAYDEQAACNHQRIRQVIKQYHLPYFYDIGEGICHQILVEDGFIQPGMLVVGSDSHTTTYGGLGSFATGIGASEMAAVWKNGHLWFKVPKSIRFDINGTLPEGVTAKDVILFIIGVVGSDGANYCSCEFHGTTVEHMSVDSRLCLCNQAMEMGAKNAVVPSDETTRKFLSLLDRPCLPMNADVDAVYDKLFSIDATKIIPLVACPHSVDKVRPAADLDDIIIDQAVIGSCTNGRLEDIASAARVLSGKKISANVRLIIVPASRQVLRDAIHHGYIHMLLQAGATIVNPGCGPCLGLHQGVLAPCERAITTTNRNFKGRMGSPKSDIFLASPHTVAASALTGHITDPRVMHS